MNKLNLTGQELIEERKALDEFAKHHHALGALEAMDNIYSDFLAEFLPKNDEKILAGYEGEKRDRYRTEALKEVQKFLLTRITERENYLRSK